MGKFLDLSDYQTIVDYSSIKEQQITLYGDVCVFQHIIRNFDDIEKTIKSAKQVLLNQIMEVK